MFNKTKLRLVMMTAIFMGLSANANAHDFTHGTIKIDHPWAAPTAGAGLPGAAYLTLINNGDQDDRLIAVKSDRAKFVEIHKSTRDVKGLAKMAVAKNGLLVKAKGTAKAAPGGDHIMLIGLETQLVEGESFPIELVFEKAGAVTVTVKVETPKTDTAKTDHSAHKGHNDHSGHH